MDKTLNMVEFYYPEEIHAFEREFVEAQQAAYMETGLEDDEIVNAWTPGGALLQRGDNEVGLPEPDGRRACSTSMTGTVPAWVLACSRNSTASLTHASTVDGVGLVLLATMGVGIKVAFGAGRRTAELVFYRGVIGVLFLGLVLRS